MRDLLDICRLKQNLWKITSEQPQIILLFISCVAASTNGLSTLRYSDGDSITRDNATTPSEGASSTSAPSPSFNSTPTEPTTDKNVEEEGCKDQIGVIENGIPINTMRKYDVEKILEDLGGAPAKVNVTWNKHVASPPIEDIKERPLPDTDNGTFWLYDYRHSDFKSYVRLEHALVRFKDTPDEFVDVRGELYWTPPDFCNYSRHAYYHQDDTGFHSKVSLEYCNIGDGQLWCAFPANCFSNATHKACVAAPSSALLASLVG